MSPGRQGDPTVTPNGVLEFRYWKCQGEIVIGKHGAAYWSPHAILLPFLDYRLYGVMPPVGQQHNKLHKTIR